MSTMETLQALEEKPATNTYGCLTATHVPVKESGEHIFAVKYSHDGKYLAATFGNGCVRTFDSETFAPLQKAKVMPQHDDLPSTSVKWSPAAHNGGAEGYNFATCSSAGAVYLWHWLPSETGPCPIDRVTRINEEGNDTSSIDYSPDGHYLCSVGSDRKVRVYDVDTKTLKDTMERGTDEQGHSRPAHSNRIFSVRFATPTTLVTAGWEAPVQIWDMRTGRSVRQLGGPQVSGDAIEILSGTTHVMVASSRQHQQLQVYDYISGREIENESEKLSRGLGIVQLLGARYSPEANAIWALGTKPDSLLCLDAAKGGIRGVVDDIGVPMFAADVCPTRPERCAFAGMKETLYYIDVAPQ